MLLYTRTVRDSQRRWVNVSCGDIGYSDITDINSCSEHANPLSLACGCPSNRTAKAAVCPNGVDATKANLAFSSVYGIRTRETPIYIFLYLSTCYPPFTHTYARTHACTHARTHARTYTYYIIKVKSHTLPVLLIYTSYSVYVCTSTYNNTHARTRVHIRTHTHVHTHTHNTRVRALYSSRPWNNLCSGCALLG